MDFLSSICSNETAAKPQTIPVSCGADVILRITSIVRIFFAKRGYSSSFRTRLQLTCIQRLADVYVFRSPVVELKLAPFGHSRTLSLWLIRMLCLFLFTSPFSRFLPTLHVLSLSPYHRVAAWVLSHPQYAHRTRPGRKSFPLRRT